MEEVYKTNKSRETQGVKRRKMLKLLKEQNDYKTVT